MTRKKEPPGGSRLHGGAEAERTIQDSARSPLRIVIASHSHPEVSNGGAEIAAFQLFRSFQERSDCEAWFIGCDRNAQADRPGAVICQPFSDREFLYAAGEFEWFKFANRDHRFPAEIERLFADLSPDVVHFHHYINFGVEVFQQLKRAVPNCKILLTLHEYLAICHHFGQMVTTRHRNLCYQSSPVRFQQCFPEFDKSDFFLRKRYVTRFFDLVDGFIAPSRFLAERYIAWGIPHRKMTVLENLVPPGPAPPSCAAPSFHDDLLRIGFFGQISVLKGINVILDAADVLIQQQRNDVTFDIFGDYRGQPPEFQNDFLERLGKAGRNVRFHGPYDQMQLDDLMRSVDAIVVPSIWWENSPVVIQEAFRNRRPVICSNIGGMAEKVRDGIDGFHFPVGSSVDLALLLKRLADDRTVLGNLMDSLQPPPPAEALMEAHLQLYHRVRE